VLKGGYIAIKETAPLTTILMSCGSELQHAVAAAAALGAGTRVVSIPSFKRFNAQPQAYRDEVLPPSCRKRVAIEAGVADTWFRYVGLDGKTVTIDRFGLSAPGNKVMEKLNMTAQAVIDAVKSLG
jgi:transketolase